MLRFKISTIGIFLFLASAIHAQPRNAGRMVVPRGYENYDSLRVGMFDIGKLAGLGDALANSVADSLQCTMEFAWEGSSSTMLDLKGKRKGVMQADIMTNLTEAIKQRYYYALPFQITFIWTSGFFWRYNAANINPAATYYNNSYDANDISPYSEYPANHDTVVKTYATSRWLSGGSTIVDSMLAYGDEGQPILAYNDDRIASHLLLTDSNTFFPQGSGGKADAAQNFSATLEFNIDTTNIDTTNANGRSIDDLPLLRLQVLFKKGAPVFPDTVAAWTVQPFTPFRDAAHASTAGAGWYKVTDVIVTRKTYRLLDSCWKSEDSLENGTVSHSWRFKQLHVLLQDLPISLRSLIIANRTNSDWWGHDWGAPASTSTIDTFLLPDSIVGSSSTSTTGQNLLELRVLSTYRATVRVRGLTWEDTIADKYFYRKRLSADSTHSLNPNGAIGGFDDSIAVMLAGLKAAGAPNEFMINDVDQPVSGEHQSYSFGMMGYADYMGGKYGMAPHYREQDQIGADVFQLRRNRLVYDGQPPSMFENQNMTYWTYLPRDYVANVSPSLQRDTVHPAYWDMVWVMMNTPIAGDTLASYKYFTQMQAGLPLVHEIRRGARNALQHPRGKRMAYEYSMLAGLDMPYIWLADSGTDTLTVSGIKTITTFDHHLGDRYKRSNYYPSDSNGFYTDHPLHGADTTEGRHFVAVRWFDSSKCSSGPPIPTPEEMTATFFSMIANGVSSLSFANPFNIPNVWGNQTPFLAGIGPITKVQYANYPVTHSYNVGHEYGATWFDQWTLPDTNDMDGNLPYYYLGYSNSWRAWQRLIGRINTIYDSTHGRITPHPLRYMRWLDAYSNNRSSVLSSRWENSFAHPGDWDFNIPMDSHDSISKANGFLKVEKTQSVDHWNRHSDGSYIDLTATSDETAPNDTASYVEVGLFIDSISTLVKNYAAMIVNTRLYPTLNDPTDSIYYNQGLTNSKDRSRSILGDIDVRKVYLKLDLTKTNTTFSNHIYYVVRDLWHPDSTWLLNKDSTFAIYIKPGDAKFLYFEPGIAVNVAARTGTDTGISTQAEFGFNNGRRVIQILRGTHDVITYTRNNHLYVAYPAAGSTFSGSPDQSSGDNIITGYEQALDTTHFCARPSIAVAMNDTGVALTWWYKDTSGNGHVAAAYRKAPGAAWNIVRFGTIYPDTSTDYHMVTPVITPIDSLNWLIAAGQHNPASGTIWGQVFVTPPSALPLAGPIYALWGDIMRPDGSIAQALFPTLASRPLWGPPWNVHLAWQQDIIANVNQIYFRRFANLPSSIVPTPVEDISIGLGACDNIHPSLALGGTYEYAGWLLPGFLLGYDTFYHDQLAWEAMSSWIITEFPGTGGSYVPVLRARHEGFAPIVYPGSWGRIASS